MSPTAFQILLALSTSPRTPSELLENITALDPEAAPPVATFYRHLKRAVDASWVEVDGEIAPQDGPGRPGHLYRISEAGRSAARREALRLRRLADLALAADPEPSER